MLRALILLTLSLTLASAALAQQPVRLLANTSPPYADAKLPEQGLALELVQHIFSRTDYQPEISIEPWSRAMEGVRVGVFDALATAWYTEERNQDFLFSEPYLSSRLVIVKSSSDHTVYHDLQDLAGRRLGVRADYAYGIDFGAIPGLQLVEENHLIQSLLNLINGQVDFVIGDQRTMVLQLNEYLASHRGKIKVIDMPLPSRERHVAAGRNVPNHADMIKAFNRALAQARKDGSYDAIVSKWDQRLGSLD
jgi:polar amino acid transport system substrate-binding protein